MPAAVSAMREARITSAKPASPRRAFPGPAAPSPSSRPAWSRTRARVWLPPPSTPRNRANASAPVEDEQGVKPERRQRAPLDKRQSGVAKNRLDGELGMPAEPRTVACEPPFDPAPETAFSLEMIDRYDPSARPDDASHLGEYARRIGNHRHHEHRDRD